MAIVPAHDFGQNKNNPTKEILASSGIWDDKPYASTPYAIDMPNSVVPNTGINTTTTTSTTPALAPSTSGSAPFFGIISSGNLYIDDMLIFNNYIHYDTKSGKKEFNTQQFLEKSLVTFARYGATTGISVGATGNP